MALTSSQKGKIWLSADKGRGIVVFTKEQYHENMNILLQDENTYHKLLGNSMFKCRKALEQIVHLGLKREILNKKEAKYLIPEFCRTPIIYSVPKIHKDGNNPPLRPIVNGIDFLTARMGEYINHYLQLGVKGTQAYLRDTKEMLQILEDIPVTETLWIMATADVSSLYTIIPHHLACEAVKWGLGKHTTLPCVQKKILSEKFRLLSQK